MTNIKKRDFYDVITGYPVSKERYGLDATVFKKVDNVDLIFDSRGQYLGIRTCRGKIINGRYTCKKGGISDFKSFTELKIWEGIRCPKVDFIETKAGNFIQIKNNELTKDRMLDI